jgi:predicted membrane-bound spermidine synthase
VAGPCSMSRPSLPLVLVVVFALSGFSGLIYESLWTHYLKLFLGHAAYAQTLVLAIFMGGLAVGSWLCSRWSSRWSNLLRGYAVTEGVIGVCALGFHPTFERYQSRQLSWRNTSSAGHGDPANDDDTWSP